MKENSPTCARPTRGDRDPQRLAADEQRARRDHGLQQDDRPTVTAITIGSWPASAGKSINMPSEMKNRPDNMSRTGRTSAYA